VAIWDVEADGSLSQEATRVAPPTGGVLPFSLTPIPGTEAFLVTDPGIGFDIFDLSTSGLKGNSSKSSAVKIDGQVATCWSSFSHKTGNYYLTDAGTSTVTEVSVDKDLKAAIVKVGTVNAITTANAKSALVAISAEEILCHHRWRDRNHWWKGVRAIRLLQIVALKKSVSYTCYRRT
jgi:hypothetical protein